MGVLGGRVSDLPPSSVWCGCLMGVLIWGVVARVAKAMGMDVIAYTASPRKTPESKRDEGFIVPGTGDPDGSLPSAWYSGTAKEDLHNFLKQEIDLLVIGVPLTYVPSSFTDPLPSLLCTTNSHTPTASTQRTSSRPPNSPSSTPATRAARTSPTSPAAPSSTKPPSSPP